MTILDAILQGTIQGLTEFLPVSSSGHLSLVQHFTGQGGETGGMFSIFLHMGTLVAVLLAFYRLVLELVFALFAMLKDLVTGKFSRRRLYPERRMIFLLVVSMLPLGAAFFLKDFFSRAAADDDILVEGVCFLITAVLLFLSDKAVKGHKNAADMKYSDAVAMGIAQAVAPMPGISRSGSTVAVGLMMGLEREYAVAFSFLMGVPAVFGANLLEFVDILEGSAPAIDPIVLVVGMGVAAVTGFLAIWMVKWIVNTDRFKWFGWYTLLLGLATIGIGLYEKLNGITLYEMFH